MPRALDRLGELALLLGRNGGDARRDDLAPLGDEALEQAYVLIIDAGSVLAGERAALAAAEKWACHMSDPSRLAVAVVAVTAGTALVAGAPSAPVPAPDTPALRSAPHPPRARTERATGRGRRC